MLNILKWDFIGYIKRVYWLYLGFAVAFVLAILPFGNPVNNILDGISTAYGAFFCFWTFIISIFITTRWLRRKSSLLELSLPVKPWKKLLGKLILSACIIASTLLLARLLWQHTGSRFGQTMYAEITVYFQFLLFMLTVVTCVMFSYITAKSFAPTRNIAGLIAFLVFVGIYSLIVTLAFVPMNFTVRQAEIITLYNNSFLISNAITPDWLQTAISLIAPAVLIVIFFFASSALLKRRFERY